MNAPHAVGGLPPSGAEEVTTWRARKRRELLAARLALSPEEHSIRSATVCARVAALLRAAGAQRVGAYVAIRGEVDVLPTLVELGSGIWLPVATSGQPLRFAPWRPGNTLLRGALGVPEPATAQEKPQPASVVLDLLLVPVLGFDDGGYRLGYGGGFYDRTLEEAQAFAASAYGVGFAAGLLPTVYPQAWDVPLQAVLTEA